MNFIWNHYAFHNFTSIFYYFFQCYNYLGLASINVIINVFSTVIRVYELCNLNVWFGPSGWHIGKGLIIGFCVLMIYGVYVGGGLILSGVSFWLPERSYIFYYNNFWFFFLSYNVWLSIQLISTCTLLYSQLILITKCNSTD